MHENSRLMFKEYAQQYFHPDQRVLEIGPDRHPSTFLEMLGFTPAAWDTLDIERAARPTFLLTDENNWPIDSNSYDVVFCAQVLEHVRRPWEFVARAARVCKPGGVVIVIVPVSWPYHVAPIDAWRIYPAGMEALFDHAGLKTVVSTWGSLEDVGIGTPFPGRSLTHVTEPGQKAAYEVNRKVGGIVECAFDCVGIGRK